MTDKLYYVEMQVNEFEGYKDVPFTFFNWGPVHHQRSYADLIEGYDPEDHGAGYAEGFIDELFTEDEAKQLKAYLDQANGHEGVTTIREVELPVPHNIGGYGSRAVGGGDGFLMIFGRPDYPLPFNAAAYYDLSECGCLGLVFTIRAHASDLSGDFPF